MKNFQVLLLLLFCYSMLINRAVTETAFLDVISNKTTKQYSALNHEFHVFGHRGAETRSCLIGTSAGKHVIFINNGSFHMLNTHSQ